MKYKKGIILGTTASVMAGVLFIAVSLIIAVHNLPQGVLIDYDLRLPSGLLNFWSILSTPSFWMIAFWLTAVGAFALGFWWPFRRGGH
jgi:zinc transporter ZupT